MFRCPDLKGGDSRNFTKFLYTFPDKDSNGKTIWLISLSPEIKEAEELGFHWYMTRIFYCPKCGEKLDEEVDCE
jgi:hypothetical protein